MTRKNLYFAVEVQYIHGKPVEADGRIAVPQYLCYFGAGADAQIQEQGCFVITDAHDRLWFCRELTEPPGEELYAKQLFDMGYLAHKIGINEGGKMFHGNADDQDDLRDELGAVG